MTLNLKVMPLECGDEIWHQKTRITLPYGKEVMIVCRTVWAQSTNVTDGQTNRQTDRFAITNTALCTASRGKNFSLGMSSGPRSLKGSVTEWEFPVGDLSSGKILQLIYAHRWCVFGKIRLIQKWRFGDVEFQLTDCEQIATQNICMM